MSLGLAFVTGLVGTLHCAAMCGPLAVAGSAGGRAPAYFAGRLLSYATVGAIMGFAGEHALCALPVDRIQMIAVVFVGLFAAWKAVTLLRRPRPAAPIQLGRRRRPLSSRLLSLVPRRGFGLGLATGVLPCGMLIPAWTLAMGAGDAIGGATVMSAFFAGSAPGLVAPLLAGGMGRRLGLRLPRLAHAAAWGLLALWIAARPMLAMAHHHHH